MYRTAPTEGGCELPGEICRPPVGPEKARVGGPAGKGQFYWPHGPDLGLSAHMPDLGAAAGRLSGAPGLCGRRRCV